MFGVSSFAHVGIFRGLHLDWGSQYDCINVRGPRSRFSLISILKDSKILYEYKKPPWISYTNDKTFVIPKDKVMVITQADNHLSHYYEIILTKVLKAKKNVKPPLSAEEMDKIYALADQMDQMQKIDQREAQWSEEDLIDLFGKKTIH